MSSSDKPDSSCLVARAVPHALPSQQICTLEPKNNSKDKSKEEKNDTDSLVSNFIKLSVNKNQTTTKKPVKVADPVDFVTLQSLRSSALARKTNTTSKFGRHGANLFADLLSNEEEEQKPVEKIAEKEEKKDEKIEVAENKVEKVTEEKPTEEKDNKEKEDELLSRGPVRTARSNVNYHPYSGSNPYPSSNESFDQACAAFGHPYAMQTPYEYGQWNTNREILSSSSTPDTVSTDMGYSSSSTSPHQQCTSTSYLMSGNTVLPSKDDAELPDALSDFILKYSRSYRGPNNINDRSPNESSGMLSPKTGRPPSADSNICDSPLSAVGVPECSPAAPHGGITGPSTPLGEYRGCNKMGPLRTQLPSGQFTAYLGRQNGGQQTEQHPRPAKELLKKLVSVEEMDNAWVWTSKCMQNYPGALCHQDEDLDSLLHIVIEHMDLGKIYALVEQMLKTEYPGHQKPFDMKNRYNETPLFLAVKKGHNEIVDYLLEAGADPNCQNSRSERDGPLHLAAKLGMAEIVKTLCSYNTANLNAVNGLGLTPLLYAVKNHGVYDEEGGYAADNTQVIQLLIKFGADPLIVDATNGKTVMHYVQAPEIIDIFKDQMDEELLSTLVNKLDYNNESALLQAQNNTDESIRFKLCLNLIMVGATNDASSP